MVESTNEAREEEAERIVQTTGALFIHPSEDPRVIAGQGTASLEFVQQVKDMGKDLDAVIIPVGGGGLAAGNTITLRALLGDKVKVRKKTLMRSNLPIIPTSNEELMLLFGKNLIDYSCRTGKTG